MRTEGAKSGEERRMPSSAPHSARVWITGAAVKLDDASGTRVDDELPPLTKIARRSRTARDARSCTMRAAPVQIGSATVLPERAASSPGESAVQLDQPPETVRERSSTCPAPRQRAPTRSNAKGARSG